MAIDYNKYIQSSGTHYISNSGGDERGKITGGKAGDQNKKEWQLRAWYNRPWTHVFRHPDPLVRRLIAELAIEGALNDKIGYDQYQRGTFWAQLKAVGYRPKNITVACEEDCSAGVNSVVKAAGYLLGNKKLQGVCSSNTSRNTRTGLKLAGFEVLTASKYLTSGKYLLPGDVLLYENHHVATNITRGSKAVGSVATHEEVEAAISGGKGGGKTDSKPEITEKPASGPYVQIVNCEACNLRLGPGTGWAEVGTVKEGAILTPAPDDWVPVVIGKNIRWVSSKYAMRKNG